MTWAARNADSAIYSPVFKLIQRHAVSCSGCDTAEGLLPLQHQLALGAGVNVVDTFNAAAMHRVGP